MQFTWKEDISEWMWVNNGGETECWWRKYGPAGSDGYFGILPFMGREGF